MLNIEANVENDILILKINLKERHGLSQSGNKDYVKPKKAAKPKSDYVDLQAHAFRLYVLIGKLHNQVTRTNTETVELEKQILEQWKIITNIWGKSKIVIGVKVMARRDITFLDGKKHTKGHWYQVGEDELAYYRVCYKDYALDEQLFDTEARFTPNSEIWALNLGGGKE